jgi:UDP-N-acetylglucosamine 4,6-dehydratase
MNLTYFNDKTILITGGTGSFGKAFTKYVLTNSSPSSIRIYSRDELKQWQLKKSYANHKDLEKLRFFIGDVRDKSRLTRAMSGADIVVHAAALKQVPACEYNPIEAINTNIIGAINVIDAALDNNADKVIALSTDKASEPINLYGATKLCSDKLFIQANNYRGERKTAFSVVRYGNVMGSRGSVIPLFYQQAHTGKLSITHKEMTRFWITLEQAVKFVLSSLLLTQGGELFVPKIPSMKIVELAKTIAPDAKLEFVGVRPGEKLHESLISENEALNTYDLGDRYLIKPTYLEVWNDSFPAYKLDKLVDSSFSYTSENNPEFLNSSQMAEMLKNSDLINKYE